MFHHSLKITAKRLSLLLLVYFGLRLAFYYFNQDVFEAASTGQLLLAFLHGIRFDISAILYLNLPFVVLSVFPGNAILAKKSYQRFLRLLFLIPNTIFFFLNILDIEYFKFIGRRTSNELFTISQDIADQAGHLALDYWYFIFFTLVLGFAIYKVYPAYPAPNPSEAPYWKTKKVWGHLLFAIIFTLAIRGGMQYKPLRLPHAFVHEPAVLGNLVLNSTFTFLKSLKSISLERDNYFKDQPAVAQYLEFQPAHYLQASPPAQRENVVIIILESFSSEYIGIENNGLGYTPFFDSLATQGAFFRHNYANGKKSIQALPSILSGLPSLMETPIISSVYESNQIFGLGTILGPAGYTTSFYHGAVNGTMGFNAYSKTIGIQRYYGLNEYPENLKARDYDGLWGIVDEAYLQYVCNQLTLQKQPFATTVFTLSSHDPYYVPSQYAGKFPKGDLAIHETIGYTDYALRQFFKLAAQQPWYPNTLFILTGDHTHKTSVKSYKNLIGMYKVPLLFFHPTKKFPAVNVNQISQHADILPTLVDYLQVPTNRLLPFGHSLLDPNLKGKAMFFLNGIATLLHQDYITQILPDKSVKLYQYQIHNLKPIKQEPPAIKKKYQTELQAYLQYFRNGLLENNLYYWIPKKLSVQATD